MKQSQLQEIIDGAERIQKLNEFIRDLKRMAKELAASDQSVTISFSRAVKAPDKPEGNDQYPFIFLNNPFVTTKKSKPKEKVKAKLDPSNALRVMEVMLALATKERDELITKFKQPHI